MYIPPTTFHCLEWYQINILYKTPQIANFAWAGSRVIWNQTHGGRATKSWWFSLYADNAECLLTSFLQKHSSLTNPKSNHIDGRSNHYTEWFNFFKRLFCPSDGLLTHLQRITSSTHMSLLRRIARSGSLIFDLFLKYHAPGVVPPCLQSDGVVIRG